MNLIKKTARTLYKWWMAFAHFLGMVNAAILLTVVYTFVIGILSVIVRLLRRDLMTHRASPAGSFWRDKEPVVHTIDHARHQF